MCANARQYEALSVCQLVGRLITHSFDDPLGARNGLLGLDFQRNKKFSASELKIFTKYLFEKWSSLLGAIERKGRNLPRSRTLKRTFLF